MSTHRPNHTNKLRHFLQPAGLTIYDAFGLRESLSARLGPHPSTRAGSNFPESSCAQTISPTPAAVKTNPCTRFGAVSPRALIITHPRRRKNQSPHPFGNCPSPPVAALSWRRGCYKKSARVLRKDLSVTYGGKKRENGQKSRAGVLHPLFFILLLLLTIRSK